MKVKKKSFLITALTCLMALCLSLSVVTVIGSATANAQGTDKTLTYTVSCYNAAGASKGFLGANPWGSMKKNGCKYTAQNIIFNSESRYITVAFNEAVSAEEYESIDFGMNFYGGPTVKNNAEKAQIYNPALVGGKASGTSRTDTGIEVDAGWFIDENNGGSPEMTVPVSNVSIPTEALKQEDGKVYGFTIRCVAEASGGAHFAIMSDIVAKAKVVLDKEEETSTEKTVTYDCDGTQVYGVYKKTGANETALGIESDNYSNLFAGNDGSTKLLHSGALDGDGYIVLEFAKKINVNNFQKMTVSYCAGNWTDSNVITKVYKMSDTECTTVIASNKTGYSNVCGMLELNTADFADEQGYIDGIRIKREASENKGTGQYFFDYVSFEKVLQYDVTVKDGEETQSKTYNEGDVISLSDIAKDEASGFVVGFSINGKFYSAAHSITVSENTVIEVIRLQLNMRFGASIRIDSPTGLRFTAEVEKVDYDKIVSVAGKDNIVLGMKITREDNQKTVMREAEKTVENGEGKIVYSGVIVSIPETNYKTEFSAVAYANITYFDGSSKTIYATENDNTRSVYDVAQNAIDSGTLPEEQREFCENIVITANGGATPSSLPDYDVKKKELAVEISGWLIPKNLNEENVKWIKKAGISTVFAAAAGRNETLYFDNYDDTAKSALKLLGDNGVKVYVNTSDRSETAFDKIKYFANDSTVRGMFWDEPSLSEIDLIAKQVEKYNSIANGKNLFANLLPSVTFSSITKYKEYLNKYCGSVLSKVTTGERWISADRYLLTYDSKGNKCLDENWLADVQAVAEAANANGAKKNFFIQTMPYGAKNGVSSGAVVGSRDRVPTYEDIRLQEYALMAFGYDGFSLFCYATPCVTDNEFSSEQYAMIGRDGAKTDIYASVAKANKEILNFDHVIKQFNWQGVFTCNAGATLRSTTTTVPTTSNASFKNLDRISFKNVSCLESLKADKDTLFGYFKDDSGNDGIMAVNYNETSKNLTDTVTFTFDQTKYNRVVCYENGIMTYKSLVNGEISLTLGAGAGVFVIPYAE